VSLPVLAALTALPLLASRAECVGGTVSEVRAGDVGALDVSDERYLAFFGRKRQYRVPYDRVRLLEYGQTVNRRLVMGAVISPMFLLAKSRKHFLSISFLDEEGRGQALVFRVDKQDIRALLLSLEVRTGRKVEFQDEEARKAGRGGA
jgi:hypothetical protein